MNKDKILRELSAVPDNFLSASYNISLYDAGRKVLQMKYNSVLAASLKSIDLAVGGKIDKDGFVYFLVEFNKTNWEVIMT